MDGQPPQYSYPSRDAFRPHGGPPSEPFFSRGGGSRGRGGYSQGGRGGGRGGGHGSSSGYMHPPPPHSRHSHHGPQYPHAHAPSHVIQQAALPPPSRASQCPRSAFMAVAHPSATWVEQQLRSTTSSTSVIEQLEGLWLPTWPNSTVGEVALRAVQCRWLALTDAYQVHRKQQQAPLIVTSAAEPVEEEATTNVATGEEMEGDVPCAALQNDETGPTSTATAATPMMKEVTATEDSTALPTAAGLPQDEIATTPDEEQHDETASAQQSLRKDRLPKSVSITLHAIFLPRHSVEAPLIRGDGDDAAAGGGLNSTDPSAEVLIAPPLPRAPPKLVPLQNVTFIRVSLPRASASSSNEASTPNTTEELAAGGNLSSSPSRPSTSDDTTASDVYDEVMVLRRDHEGNKRTLSSIPDVAGQFSNAGGGDVAMMFCASVHSMHW